MLIQIEIKNFAIIEHSIINFDNGFNVITGETGAGKSILFDALSCIIGERTSKDLVRKGMEKAELKAVFLKTEAIERRLKEKNIEISDDIVIIERTISSNGKRSIAKINGSIQTSQTIKEVCQDLIEICGQKAHLELLQEDKYLHLIDGYADAQHLKLLSNYHEKYFVFKDIQKQLNILMNKEREQEQLLDLYRFQKEEIEKLQLKIGEDESLVEEERFLAGFDEIKKNASLSLDALYVIDTIYEAKEFLNKALKYDDKLQNISERIEKSYYDLEDAKRDLESYIDNIDYDENRLNQVIQRLDSIKLLKRKYSDTIEGILRHYKEVSIKIDDFENKDEKIHQLQKQLNSILSELHILAKRLHENRVMIGQNLAKNINKELKELYMPDAIFLFDIVQTKELNEFGWSNVQILFNANKGEEPKPLSKIASGGEMSRVLLAMKIVSNIAEEIDTIIFDEIDEGIGGEVGRIIGQKLFKLGQQTQVIAISHLPQVAAKAHQHFLIKKEVKDERTISYVSKLSSNERTKEIARMIYGEEMNETTLKQAEEMLK